MSASRAASAAASPRGSSSRREAVTRESGPGFSSPSSSSPKRLALCVGGRRALERRARKRERPRLGLRLARALLGVAAGDRRGGLVREDLLLGVAREQALELILV